MEQNNKEKGDDLLLSLSQICRKPNNNRLGRISHLLNQRMLDALEENISLKESVLLTILQLSEKYRTVDIRGIIEHLLSDIGCFEKILQTYGKKAVEELYGCLESSEEPAGRHLIKTGDESDRLFIILRGEVMVLYPRPQKDIDKDTQGVDRELVKGLSKNNKILTVNENSNLLGGIELKIIENYANFFNNMGVCLYQLENIMTKGSSFGQLGILYKQKRMSHIVCITDCLFASVSADRYMEIIQKTEQYARFYSTMFFLEQHFYSSIRQLNIKDAQRFMYMFVTQEKKINSTIVDLKSVVNGAYFVLEGSVVLRRQDALSDENNNGLHFFLQKRKKKLQDFKTLITGDCFGLNECVDNQLSLSNTFFEYEAVAASNCKLLFCPSDKLLKAMKEDHCLEKELQEKCKKGFWVNSRNSFAMSNFSELLQMQKQKFPSRYYIKLDHSDPSIIRSQSKKKGVNIPISFEKYQTNKTFGENKTQNSVRNSVKCMSEAKTLRLSMKKRLQVLTKKNIVKTKELQNKSFERPKFSYNFVTPIESKAEVIYEQHQ